LETASDVASALSSVIKDIVIQILERFDNRLPPQIHHELSDLQKVIAGGTNVTLSQFAQHGLWNYVESWAECRIDALYGQMLPDLIKCKAAAGHSDISEALSCKTLERVRALEAEVDKLRSSLKTSEMARDRAENYSIDLERKLNELLALEDV
jgi:hypothetical protein